MLTRHICGAMQMAPDTLYDHSGNDEVVQDVSVASLLGVIQQLGKLSKYSAELFGGIQEKVNSINQRAAKVHHRLGDLQKHGMPLMAKITAAAKMGPDEFITKETPLDRSFQPYYNMFTPESRPQKIQEDFNKIAPPPQLDLLDKYQQPRPESKLPRGATNWSCDGETDTNGELIWTPPPQLSKYTDPAFFRREWEKAELARNELAAMKKRKRKKERKRAKASRIKEIRRLEAEAALAAEEAQGLAEGSTATATTSPARAPPTGLGHADPVASPEDDEPTGVPIPTRRQPPPQPDTQKRASPVGRKSPPQRPQATKEEDPPSPQGMSPVARRPPPQRPTRTAARTSPSASPAVPSSSPPRASPRRPAPVSPQAQAMPAPAPATPAVAAMPADCCEAKDHPDLAKYFMQMRKQILPMPVIKRNMGQHGLDPEILSTPHKPIKRDAPPPAPGGRKGKKKKRGHDMAADLAALKKRLAKAPPKVKSKAKKTMSLLEQIKRAKKKKLKKIDRVKIARRKQEAEQKQKEEEEKKNGHKNMTDILAARRAAMEGDSDSDEWEEDGDDW